MRAFLNTIVLPWQLLTVLLAPAPARGFTAAHPTAEEIVSLTSAGEAKLSPDGTRVAFTLASVAFDSTANPAEGDTHGGWKRSRQLWIVDLASRATRALTAGDAAVSLPAWAPDGRSLAFVRREDGKARLFVLPLEGGEARAVKTGALEPGDPAWSPDGRSLAFLAEAEPADSTRRARWRRGGAIEWEKEFANTRLWVVPAAGGEPRLVATPGNVTEFAWSPDGRRFAVVISATADPYLASNLHRIRLIDAASGASLRELDRPASPVGAPAWSPDGASVALLGVSGGLSDTNALLVWNTVTGSVRDLAPDRDRTFTALAWSGDSRSVIAAESFRAGTRLVRYPLAGAPAVLPFPADRVVAGALSTDTAGRRVALLSATADLPADVTVFEPSGGRVTIATTLHPEVRSWTLGHTEIVKWNNAEGTALEGVLVVSPAAKPGVPAPLVVYPHGGPDDATSVRFSGLVQYLCARGYSVFEPNYRGSTSYGFAHYAANRNRFGEIEQADIESGVDALIRAGKADAKKLYYGGWSWGGYLTCWTITQVHRYRAAVAGAAVSDVTFSYSLSDINHGVAAQWEYEGDPWRQLEHFDRPNPIRYVKNVTTPLLLLHGQSDTRVPFPESAQFYRALSDLDREVKFWAYPGENHGFVEPAHLVHRLHAWADWYDTH